MEKHVITRNKRRSFNVPGHLHFLTFSCFQRLKLLNNLAIQKMLGQAVRSACLHFKVALWAYVFMPEHVHLLLKPIRVRYDIDRIRGAIRQSTAKRAINLMKDQDAPILQKLPVRERIGKRCFRFWEKGPGHDKNIWSMDKAIEKARYCHRNPIERGLVSSPELWQWSSFRWLEFGNRTNEPLIVDDWDERLLNESPEDMEYSQREMDRFINEVWGQKTGGSG